MWPFSLFLYKLRIETLPVLPRMYFPEASPVERLSLARILRRHIGHVFLLLCRVRRSALLTGVLYLEPMDVSPGEQLLSGD